MSKNIIIATAFSLIVGLGLGLSIGRSSNAFKMGAQQSDSMGHNATSNKMTSDLGKKDADFDLRFINEMIVHHEGAIDMAKQAQQNSDRIEIKNLSDEIIAAQSKEIEQMNKWKEMWYGDR